jgi:hypothetical protein
VLAPLYAWAWAAAQRAPKGSMGAGAGRAGQAYALLEGDGHKPVRLRLLAAAFPLGIRGLNLLGIGPLSADLSGASLRRNALRAFGEVVRRLDIEAEHVIFGHSHRTGPLPGDDLSEWEAPTGSQLTNTGNWVDEALFLSGSGPESPYWPGGAVVVSDTGPPEVLRLLDDLPRDEEFAQDGDDELAQDGDDEFAEGPGTAPA